jgi:hypothetical protein
MAPPMEPSPSPSRLEPRMGPECVPLPEGSISRLFAVQGDELRARYELSQSVARQRASSSSARERHALVGAVASRLGTHESAVNRLARVSESIDAADFERLLEPRRPGGSRLTWSHIEVLSALRHGDSRLTLGLRAAAEDWSVRQLAEEVRRLRRLRRIQASLQASDTVGPTPGPRARSAPPRDNISLAIDMRATR